MNNAFLNLLMIFLLFFTGTYCVNAAEIFTTPSASENYRDIKIQAFRGLPRFGILDISGLKKQGEKIEEHNYSIGILTRLDFMRQYKDCFKNMNGYEVRMESCYDRLIAHNAQINNWKKYIEMMAFSLKPEAYVSQFCLNEKQCTRTQIDKLYKRTENGKSMPFNEFEKRDFVRNLMDNQYEAFEKYWNSIEFPEEAYVVNMITLGDYDFDQQHFTFRLNFINSLITQNISGGIPVNQLNSKQLSVQAAYNPTLLFEKEFKNFINQVLINLPMKPDQAQQFVQGDNQGRQYYAAVKIKFLERSLAQYDLLKNMNVLAYHFAVNKVELFTDEALTQKAAEVSLVRISEDDKKPENVSKITTYSLAKNSRFLDYRSMSLLRYKNKQSLLSKDINRIASDISTTEQNFWFQYKQRLDSASRPIGSAKNKAQQERLKNQKKMAADRAKLSNWNWQEIEKMSADQQKIFYNYMLGYKKINGHEISWPQALPSVTWGMNLATIFKQGYFPDKKESLFNTQDKRVRELIQKFLNDIGKAQDLNNLTLVYRLKDISYDQNKESLIINPRTWPFSIIEDVTFTDDSDLTYQSQVPQLVHSEANGRAVYRFRTSNQNLGLDQPNPQFRSCTQNQKRKSFDCVTTYPTFMSLNFANTYLALDREIVPENVPLSIEKGLDLMKMYQPSGWRLVIEITDSRMELVKYNFIHQKSKKDQQGESQTVLSNVKKILILAPNDEIIWSKKGADLNSPKKKLEINNSHVIENNNQNDRTSPLKSLQAVAQCRHENIQKQTNFNNCENLRVQLEKAEETVKLNEIRCEEKESLDANTAAEIENIPGPCKYSKDLDLRFIGNEMKKCILDSCGQPTVISNIQNYQSCVMKIQIQVQKIMESATLSMQKSQLLINECAAPKQQVLSLQNNLTVLNCSQYSKKPELKNCK